jgi:hypothetical protein
MARENPLTFYVRYGAAEIRNLCSATITFMRLKRLLKRLLSDPLRREYRDQAIKPTDSKEFSRELYTETRGSAEAIAKERRQKQIVYAARAS